MSVASANIEKVRASNIWKRDEHDWYREPDWCSARLFEEERFSGDVIDPACGCGRIMVAAAEAGLNTVGTDIVKRWDGTLPVKTGLTPTLMVDDFLSDQWGFRNGARVWWNYPRNVVCNPPFKDADAFVQKALQVTASKVAMLLPLKWMAGVAKGRPWLVNSPLYRVWILTPRPSMPPGAVIDAGEKPGGGTVDFAWFVWLRGFDGSAELRWLSRDKAAA
jgi:hypothetical protein